MIIKLHLLDAVAFQMPDLFYMAQILHILFSIALEQVSINNTIVLPKFPSAILTHPLV